MISADEPEHSDALQRCARLDRAKRLERAAQGLHGQAAALKRENGEKATRVTTLDGGMRPTLGDADQAKREDETGYDQALRQNMLLTSGEGH